MGQILTQDKIGALSLSGGTDILMAASTSTPAYLTIGGQQYAITSNLTRTISTDVTLAASSIYQIFAVVSGGVVALRISTNGVATGPVGFTSWKLLGSFYTNAASTFAALCSSGCWAPQTAYNINDVVTVFGYQVKCLVTHTSSNSYTTDAALNYWQMQAPLRNRIINGDMSIDQKRNGGAISAADTDNKFLVDRWYFYSNPAAKFNSGQNQLGFSTPNGFTKYMNMNCIASHTASAAEYFLFGQPIEGTNIADLNWGTSSAKMCTISFWARSSLTGLFSGSIANYGTPPILSFPFTYTINAANTWEYKTIVIPGPTSGTWVTNTNLGLYIMFDLGSGSNYNGTANTWNSSSNAAYRVTGSTNVAQSGANWNITGVSFNEGSAPNNFVRFAGDFGDELQACQRYSFKYGGMKNDQYGMVSMSYNDANTLVFGQILFPTLMRAAPTLTTFGTPIVKINGGANTGWAPTLGDSSQQHANINMSKTSHGLSASLVTVLNFPSTSDFFMFFAEL